jgi:molybdenum cofactor cytidylyltransferase
MALLDIDCLVPAAGRSERMGSWKPMLPFAGSTIVETVVERARAACARVVVVTGHRGEEMEALFRGVPRVHTVRNPDWELGMFSSIRCGLREIDTERFFVTLGDMPWIAPEIYAALAACAPDAVVFPVFDGRRGHPVLLTSAARRGVLEADPATGSMKEVIARLPVRELPWRDDSILRDIDRPEDFTTPA